MPSGQSQRSNSIIVGNCIRCEGLLRVSSKAKASASVRCPHCQETFPLARLLESAVPEVEIVQADAGTQESIDLYIDKNMTGKDAAGKFVVPSQLAKGARRRKSSRSGRSSSRSSSHNGSDSSRDRHSDSDHRRSDRNSARESVREMSPDNIRRNGSAQTREHLDNTSDHGENRDGSHRSTRHRDKREAEAIASEPNPVVTFLKIAAGAALALPIAYLIVMWVFSQDPLGIGERIGEKIPFAVPAAFRADTEESSDSSSDDDVPSFLIDDSDLETPDFGFGDLSIGSEALEGLDK